MVKWIAIAAVIAVIVWISVRDNMNLDRPITKSATPAKPALTIWWAQWDPAVGLQELGQEYEKATGVKVTVQQIPWQTYQDQVFLNFGNKQTDFDIVIGDSQWIGRGATKGLYLELTDWAKATVKLDEINKTALKYLCEYPTGSGRLFALPCETDAVGFAYRKDWFADPAEQAAFKAKYNAELEPPQTWDEFKRVAEFFTRPADKRYGCALLTGRGYDSLVMGFQNLFWVYGGSWGDPTTFATSCMVNSDGAIEALRFMKELMASSPAGGADLDYGKTMEVFRNGSAAMAMNYFAFFPGLVKDMGDKVGFFTTPGKNGKCAISLGGQGFSVSAKVSPAQQELAKQFIAWFQTKPVQEQWITKPAGFTANEAILKSAEFRAKTPYNGPFAESMDSLQDFWNVPVYNELLAAAQRQVGEALDGKIDAKAALDALAKEHGVILKDAGLAK